MMRISRKIAGGKLSTLFVGVFFFFIAICYFEFRVSTLSSKNFALEERLKEYGSEILERREKSFDQYHPPAVSSESLDIKSLEPLVVYNRIPKTGSTSFVNIIYSMTRKNQMYVLHTNTSDNNLKMAQNDQVVIIRFYFEYEMVKNMTRWNERRPGFYHGHFAYIPFNQFGEAEPLYINILREPLDRLVSHYYFLRYGDDYRKGLKRVKQGDKTTFDECVAKNGHDCQPGRLWLQIPLLCGQTAECWKTGSQWALQQAKNNLASKYTLVGVTEQMEDFLVVLEGIVPRIFQGAADEYRKGEKSHIRNTLHKETPTEETIKHLQNTKIYKMERDLYDFALAQFQSVKQLTTRIDMNGILRPVPVKFFYEKMYGPNGKL